MKKKGERTWLPYASLLRIGSYFKKELLLFIVIFLFYALSALANVGYARLFEYIDDAFFSADFNEKLLIPLAFLILVAVRSASTALGNLSSSYMVNTLLHNLNTKVYRHIIQLPLKFFDRSSVGEMMSKINYNVVRITDAISSGFIVLLKEGLTIIALLGYVFYLNWYLSLFIVAVIPLVVLLLENARRRLKVVSERLQSGVENVSRTMADVFGSFITVRIFSTEQHEGERFRQYSKYRRRQSLKASLVTELTTSVMEVTLSVPIALIIFIGIGGGGSAFDDIGSLLAYVVACSLLGSPLKRLSGVQEQLQGGEVAAKDYMHYLSLTGEKDDGKIVLSKKKVKGKIELSEISFGYVKGKKMFNKLDLTFKAGKKTALVGLSGSGKSTLVNLIMRLYEVQKGSILLDGVNIKDFSLKSLRRNISYIGQDVFLFNNTLRYNLLYGIDKKASDKQIKNALVQANAWSFVKDMPDGLDTRIGEGGVKLSGGQKQRLAIARSLFRDSKILIMDEATSALDVKNEYEIRENINNLMKSRTVIIIAHRLSTVEGMDEIVMLQKGKVVAIGKHDELLAKNKKYAELCSYQFKR